MRRRIRRPAAITVSESRGLRYLHVGGEAIQSAMRIAEPDVLTLDYTRAMMAALLFLPEPREAMQIGLGGGSIAKFLRRAYPALKQRVVELDPRVVAIARDRFGLAPDDARLSIEVGDGAEALVPESVDLLVVDGFDDEAQAPALVSGDFYDAAWLSLRSPGVLVANFLNDARRLDVWIRRMERSFDGSVVLLPAPADPNMLAFGLKGMPDSIAWSELDARAQRLKARHDLPFSRYLEAMRRSNPHTDRALRLRVLVG